MASTQTPKIFAKSVETTFVSKQYCFAKPGASGGVVPAGAGERTDGIIQNAPAVGEFAEVAMAGGGAKLLLAGTVAAGNFIKSNAAGAGVVASTDKDEYGARAEEAGVSGDIIAVEVMQGQLSV